MNEIHAVGAQKIEQLALSARRREDEAVGDGEGVERDRLLVVRLIPVVVKEDNLDSAESLLMFLRGVGHEVSVVNDGRSTVEAARKFRPEVILLDIGLPGLDGFDIAKALRELPETSAVRLIAVSGYGQEKDRARSKAAGFDLHLVKPVDPNKLAAAIEA